jgi:hypothetical protein
MGNLAFNARRLSDGNVHGEAQFVFKAPIDAVTHVTIDCLRVVDERTVVVSGVIDRVNVEVRGPIFDFIVRDGGEGSSSPPDEVSTIVFGSTTCDQAYLPGFLPTLHPFQAGNVQVRDA